MTLQMLVWLTLAGILLVCLGLLLGAAWTTMILRHALRQQAEERRQLNEEWLAVRTVRSELDSCPRCGCPLPDFDW